ncbi:shikimate dehydrogenase [Herbidospora sp. NBRC 101105]|uniref:shikimate dehydrogenase n=1 Tax=Herbidospora sp. NBRC 101105 TaxID=3032195 RepID=UPI0024A27C3E|nr:shikimate dehydrogenase [Herbidospora sp. NBRC 101105]GLX95170.1 shikimate dehydrogenase (NADP(+)) [Herbidospora sp. NBRC 101105]
MTSYLIGLIGTGIGPSLSPALHEHEADHHGLRYLYRRIELTEPIGDLITAARLSLYDGLNVTHPVKQTVIDHLDELSPDAAKLGAVNTVLFRDGRAIGHNTDWTGFAESFRRGLPGAATRHVVQLGAGGAGAAVAHALLTLGAGRVTVVDVDATRPAELAARLNPPIDQPGHEAGRGRRAALPHDAAEPGRLRAAGPAELPALLADADGLVNVTPVGMAAHPGLPLDAGLLRAELWVADVVYRPLETELLRHARRLGCRTLDGSGMVVFQAAGSFRLFTGVQPDVERMLAHLTELI